MTIHFCIDCFFLRDVVRVVAGVGGIVVEHVVAVARDVVAWHEMMTTLTTGSTTYQAHGVGDVRQQRLLQLLLAVLMICVLLLMKLMTLVFYC